MHVREFRPDVVLLDIGMPGIDGYDTCRRIREAVGSDVIIVALAGWGPEQDGRGVREAGFDAHLTKLADPATLGRLLADAKPAHGG
jgi:CheY-like chemotaxis protein